MSIHSNWRRNLAGAVASVALLTGAAGAETVLIHAGTLLAVPGQKPLTQQTLIVTDGKVSAVKGGYLDAAGAGAPADARTIDLKDSFVLPGLIDCHVHITGELGPRSQLAEVQDDPEETVLDGVVYANRTLMAGFTTVRDLGAPARTGFALRDAINKGEVEGPTILAAGMMVSITAGHGDVNGFSEEVTHALRPESICNGADDCRRAVREQIRKGADVIKLATTGGVLSNIAAGTGQQMFDDEAKAIIDTAHLMGKKVASHAHAAGGVNLALRSGVDSVEHGSFIDADSIKLFKQSGAYLVPTLLAGYTVVNMAKNSTTLTPAQAAKALDVGERMKLSFGNAVRNGVKVAFGTDSGVSAHGTNAYEFKLMVDAGMPAADAIKAATVNAADLLDRSNRIGTLEAGKDADIIAVAKSPIEDVTELSRVQFVMRQGTVHKLNGAAMPFVPKT
ncbi:amidohydrolase family protein [Niveispirillum sp.]|uniref:metal-dependent hydrolase family protein n=1 Tax=Niveispirillum sp. TaxID=1917217 RepID=UPI001B50510D|nr:amidohydrolase family protein [Niveispirillum sp.]MBP7335054.1 amidohydrolase family protein [Niveispirillum sp.]